MITRPPTRPQTLLRAVVKQTQSSIPRPQRRSKHTVPIWANHQRQEKFAKYGVPGFLSANTYQETYVKYLQSLCDRMNEMVQGTAEESTSAFELHAKCAHRADKAVLYNHAAMAEFTRVFWETLTDSDDANEHKPGLNTMRSIEKDFDSVDNLREEFLETADALFGNGFVWLMKAPRTGELTILATYNAGSPYSEAAPRRDNRDMATYDGSQIAAQLSGRSGLGTPSIEERALSRSTAGSFGPLSSARANLYLGALDAQPILCVNVWQHQWLPDWGILGKRAYLRAWWDSIDWQKVERRHCDYSLDGEADRYIPRNPYQQGSVYEAIRRQLS